MSTKCDGYASKKQELKVRLENKEIKGNAGRVIKYPHSTNSLTDDFITRALSTILTKEDLKWLVATRKQYRAKAKKSDGTKSENWFPAFRSVVGKKFFPEFGKGSAKNEVDANADYLEQLMAELFSEEGGEN